MAARKRYTGYKCPFNDAINIFATMRGNMPSNPCGEDIEECKSCGWNPEVAYKRDKYGVWDCDYKNNVIFLNVKGIKSND